MRIALFHNLPSGGATRTAYEQVRRLSQRHTIDLYTLDGADRAFADLGPYVARTKVMRFRPGRAYASPLGRLNQAVRAISLLRLRQVMEQLAGEIDGAGYDVALVHPCMYCHSPRLLRRLRVPSLYYRHDVVRSVQDPPIARPYHRRTVWGERLDRVDPLLAGYRALLESEDRRNMAAATLVVTNSHFMRESLYRIHGVAPVVSYHGVDSERFRPLGLNRDGYVLSVGMLSPAKGFDFVIRSLARIDARHRPPLVIVSNSRIEDEARYLEALATRLGVNLSLRTMVSDNELLRLYNQALCTVYAPVMESFGLVPLESMACGTPVIGICEGGVRETVVDGVTGALVDRDEARFGEAINQMVTDGSLRERLGRQARDCMLTRWTWEAAIASLEEHLLAVAQARS